MRSVMRTITNVSYDNRAVDCAEEGNAFTINSDHISYISSTYTDMETRAKFTRTLGDGVETDYSRGQRIAVSMSSGFTAGHDYMCVQTIYQRQGGDMTEETSTGAYDVYMGAGKLQDDSATVTEVYIDKDISFIKSPVWKSNNTVLCGGCVLRLSDRDLLITAYNPTTGKATVTGAKINGTTSTTRTTTKGESYKLITNYLVCDAFVFYYRTTPVISISTQLTTNGIEVTGSYSQAEGTEIQSWRMWATYTKEKIVTPSNTIRHGENFGYEIEDVFPILTSNGYDPIDPEYSAEVDIYLEVTTQDGVTVQTKEELEFSALNELTVTNLTHGTAIVTGIPEGGSVFAYLEQNFHQYDEDTSRFIGCKYTGKSTRIPETDSVTVSSAEYGRNTRYRFIVCGIDGEGNLYFGRSPAFSDPSKKWSIGKLKKSEGRYNTYQYEGGFTFEVDVQPGAIETVVGNTVYGTEGRFPKNVHGSDRYDTGTFTALLGTIYSPEYSIYNIERWTEFITQEGLFLLKTDTGDVKIITITGNPSRQYGSSIAEMGLTRITYTWAEAADIDEVTIL